MPSIDENKQTWNTTHDWPQAGEEWSYAWGSAYAQWSGCLFPRIFPFLKGRILEIAPGHGRWTQFLQAHCASLIGIDLAPSCVEFCRQRLKGRTNLDFRVNDGLMLSMVDDASVDFAFSFDSLVHAESDVLSNYAKELARVLKPGRIAFIHHSNLGAIRYSFWDKAKRRIRRRIYGLPFDRHYHPRSSYRATSMTADKIREFAQRFGHVLPAAGNHSVGWQLALLIDCMSTIINSPGKECVVIQNDREGPSIPPSYRHFKKGCHWVPCFGATNSEIGATVLSTTVTYG